MTDDPNLHNLLAQLRDEIEKTGSLDEASRAELRQLGADIARALARTAPPGAPPSGAEALAAQLEDGIARFESDHPSLTALLARLLEALSNAGI